VPVWAANLLPLSPPLQQDNYVRPPIAMTALSKRSARSIDRDFEPSWLRRRRLTIADFGVRHTLNGQSFQGFSLIARGAARAIVSCPGNRKNHTT